MNFQMSLRKKLTLASTAVFIIAAFACYGLISILNAGSAVSIKNKTEEAKKMKIALGQIKKLDSRLNSYLSLRLESSDQGWFLSRILEIADKCGIKIDSITPQEPLTDEGIKYLSCKMSFQADYDKLSLFIGRIESDKIFIRIDQMSVKPPDKKDTHGQIAVSVQLQVTGFHYDG